MDVPASAPSNRRSFLILTVSRPRTGYRLQTCGASARRVTAISTREVSTRHEGWQTPEQLQKAGRQVRFRYYPAYRKGLMTD
ncbi:hypothetical protein [Prevotella multiformis]|uniref:hypothetical protein n=1 Tax=Prevotella multiformis TaxID=282402 RepID=UPI0028DCDFCE|nr:hypothetical protein [Prevotella multiformis]